MLGIVSLLIVVTASRLITGVAAATQLLNCAGIRKEGRDKSGKGPPARPQPAVIRSKRSRLSLAIDPSKARMCMHTLDPVHSCFWWKRYGPFRHRTAP